MLLIPFISDAASIGDGLITYCAICATWLAGVIVTGGFGLSGSFSNAGATGAIVPAIVCAVVAGAMSGRIRKKHRQRDQARFDADAEDQPSIVRTPQASCSPAEFEYA